MDQDTFKLDKRKSPIIRPKPRPDSMLQAEPAPDVEFDNRDDLIQKLPRPKPRPVMIGSNPKTGATRGIDPRDNYSPEDLKRLLMQSAMERMETEGKSLASLRNRSSFDAQNRLKDQTGKLPKPKIVKPAQMDLFDNEAGDHDRMYKVVHVKKGMMDIKAKTSYEAAKKFAKEKGLKSTAGVDVHLYPLEEGAMSDLHARIMSSDDPHDEIYKMLTQDGPEAEYIQAMYNETSIDRGLHPDDDFEDIIDAMVAELDDDMPFENMNFMVAPPNKNPKFKSNMPIKPPNKNPRINTDFYKNMQKHFQQQGQEKPWWMREGYTRLPDIDRERYTEMPGLEGPFQTMSGKPIYYDPKEGSYYDRDTDMYLTYAEFKALDDPKPDTGRMKEDSYDGANPFTYKIYNDENILLADDLESALEILDGEISEQELEQIEDMAMSGDMDPLLSALDGFGYEIVMNEGKSPHKKGTEKYKKHMAAMHANSVDLNTMRDALKLDESTDANTVVAEYTRATLDRSYKTWKQVNEQIAFIRSFVKEDIDVSAVATMLRKMHERENLDHKILVKENIDKLRQIVKDKSAMPIKFSDGSMKVDMTTASIFLQIFDKVKAETQAKIVDKIQTKAGFLSVLDLMYKKIG